MHQLNQLAQLIAGLPEEPRIVVSGNFATPHTVLGEIDRMLPKYRLWVLNAQPGLPDREGVVLETSFVGPGMRYKPRLRYVPCRLSLVPQLFASVQEPNLVVLHTTPPRQGYVSMGTEVNVLPSAVEAVRRNGGKVVAQANPRMPFTTGDALLPVSDVDLIVDAEEPLATHEPLTPDETSRAIGDAVAQRVPDGATLQAGIGGVPDAALQGLTRRRGLRMWTEMFSDSALALEQAGALDQHAQLVTSFVFGSAELYDWLDGNHRVHMRRTEVTNDPSRISARPNMVSVNTALQVDLWGQANASRTPRGIYSGFGGQTDFIVGAMHSLGGQALMGLRSWHPSADVSTIVPLVHRVTSFQITAVITEQGTANMFGRDQERQAFNLIEHAAHPRAREELRAAAAELGLQLPS